MIHVDGSNCTFPYCFVYIPNKPLQFFKYDIEKDAQFIENNFDVTQDTFFVGKDYEQNMVIPSQQQYAMMLLRFKMKPTYKWYLKETMKRRYPNVKVERT